MFRKHFKECYLTTEETVNVHIHLKHSSPRHFITHSDRTLLTSTVTPQTVIFLNIKNTIHPPLTKIPQATDSHFEQTCSKNLFYEEWLKSCTAVCKTA